MAARLHDPHRTPSYGRTRSSAAERHAVSWATTRFFERYQSKVSASLVSVCRLDKVVVIPDRKQMVELMVGRRGAPKQQRAVETREALLLGAARVLARMSYDKARLSLDPPMGRGVERVP